MTLRGTPPDRQPAPVDLDDDDRPIGRILTRRAVLALLGAGGAAAFLAACAPGGAASPGASGVASAGASASASPAATAAASRAIATALPACVVAPELTEGPYYLDINLERSGRAVHNHFKIRTDPEASAGFEFTSQLFFDDELSRTVYATGVYAQKGPQDQPNASDQICNQSGGATLLTVTQEGDAYEATFPIAVQLS